MRSHYRPLLPLPLLECVTGNNVVRHGVALDFEPAPATLCVIPELLVRAARVFSHEQVVRPLCVTQRRRILRPRDTGFAAVSKLGFGSFTTVWAGNQQHRRILLMRDGRSAVLVDQCAGLETGEVERRIQLVRLIARNRVRKCPARAQAWP